MKTSMKINQLDKQGNRHGLWEIYYSDGQLWGNGEFKNGLRHGLWKYYETGQLWYKGQYQKNKRAGLWLFYRISGELYLECRYRDDLKHGDSKSYLIDGTIEGQGFFNKSRKHGLWYARYF